jgi:hypothetical protein
MLLHFATYWSSYLYLRLQHSLNRCKLSLHCTWRWRRRANQLPVFRRQWCLHPLLASREQYIALFASLEFGLYWCLCWFVVRGKHRSFASSMYVCSRTNTLVEILKFKVICWNNKSEVRTKPLLLMYFSRNLYQYQPF